MRKTLIVAALLAATQAQAQTLPTCIPSEFAGFGSTYVTAINAQGRWIGWWCPGEPNPTVYACRTASCPSTAALMGALSTFIASPHTSTLQAIVKPLTIGTAADVADVWVPDRAKLDAVRLK